MGHGSSLTRNVNIEVFNIHQLSSSRLTIELESKIPKQPVINELINIGKYDYVQRVKQ